MNKNSLLKLLTSSIQYIDPVYLLKTVPSRQLEADAYLFWGKASERYFEALVQRDPGLRRHVFQNSSILGIYPGGFSRREREGARGISGKPGIWIAGEHPLPGEGSFRAGSELLSFFDSLRRTQARRLLVFLSGGASSLAWIPRGDHPGKMTQSALLRELRALYCMGLDIDALNARRAGLCQLKGGGAAHWLSSLAPQVSVGVYVLSDVAPCGPEVVGSGPFWDGTIQHRVLADNSTWVKSIAAEARRRKINVLHCSSGRLGSWQSWMQSAIQAVMPTLRGNENGLFIFGGEPSVRLPSSLASRKPARGGRQSHLALALAHRLRPWIIDGKLEILGMSSDGSDGNSGAAGAWLDSREFSVRFAQVPDEKVRRALKQFRSAEILSQLNALVKSSVFSTRSNVQDVLMIRVL